MATGRQRAFSSPVAKNMSIRPRDHGGGIDAAIVEYGGVRSDWIDLSTGINPTRYPFDHISYAAWHDLPDTNAMKGLLDTARTFWNVPDSADIVAASGVSQIIAALPLLSQAGKVSIIKPTYNEHEAAFEAQNWTISPKGKAAVFVHPNNPDGRLFSANELPMNSADLIIIDESFCDTCPNESLIYLSAYDNVIALKGLGKFWGLGGLRLGFAIGTNNLVAPLKSLMGPWPVSGPALQIGAQALADLEWANDMRRQLAGDAKRLDDMMLKSVEKLIGGTNLFRLYSVNSASDLQSHLARSHIWSRIFPYSKNWIRLGLPGSEPEWQRLQNALDSMR